MSIKLTYREQAAAPVEVEGFTPDWACHKSLAEIERFEIFHGNQKVPLAEFFAVEGDAGDKRIEFAGDLAGVHWIGAQMRSGEIHIEGSAGRHLGSELRGGEIYVAGDAGDWVGAQMRGGLIHVRGDAGHLVGAAYRGSAQGMRGGTIIVDGSAGNEVGLLIQQGVIAIGAAAGEMIGFNMVDGTMLVMGRCGIRPGAGMRGGAIGMFGPSPPPVLSSFRFRGTSPTERFQLVRHELANRGWRFEDAAMPTEADVYVGDLVADGNGELYFQTPD